MCNRRTFALNRPEYFLASAFFAVILLSLPLLSCGKKGEPTLKSFEKPLSPSLVSTIHREDNIIISWTFPKNGEAEIAGFHLLRSSGSGFERVAFLGSDVRSYTDTDFHFDVHYSYKIVSQNHRGILSADSNVISLTPSQPPPPPQNLSVSVPDDSVTLSWKLQKDGIYCNVYRSFEQGIYGLDPLNKSPISDNTFRDVFFIDRPVYYIVRSLRNTGWRDEGPSSEEVTINPSAFVPPPPEGVRYFATSDNVYLYWKEPDHLWITGFRVYRRIGKSDYVLIGETQIPVFLDAEKPSTKRDYRITALGPEKEGPGAEIRGVVFVPD
jgi:hypothetical protein